MYTVKYPIQIYSVIELWNKLGKPSDFRAKRWSPENPSIHKVEFQISVRPNNEAILEFKISSNSTLDFTKHNSKNGWYL